MDRNLALSRAKPISKVSRFQTQRDPSSNSKKRKQKNHSHLSAIKYRKCLMRKAQIVLDPIASRQRRVWGGESAGGAQTLPQLITTTAASRRAGRQNGHPEKTPPICRIPPPLVTPSNYTTKNKAGDPRTNRKRPPNIRQKRREQRKKARFRTGKNSKGNKK